MVRVNKIKIPRAVLLPAVALLATGGAWILILMSRPPAELPPSPPTAVDNAKADLAGSRDQFLKGVVTFNFDPRNVSAGSAGLLQTVAIQRAAELREWINIQRTTKDGVYFGDTFETAVYKYQQTNDTKMVAATRGVVSHTKVYTTATGDKIPVVPTATQLLSEAALEAVAIQMLSLETTLMVNESQVQQALVAQQAVNDSLAIMLDRQGNTDAVRQIQQINIDNLVKGGK